MLISAQKYALYAVCSVCGAGEVFRPDLTPGGAYCIDHLPESFRIQEVGEAKKWYAKVKERQQ